MERLAKTYTVVPLTDHAGRAIKNIVRVHDEDGTLSKNGVPYSRITVTVNTGKSETRRRWHALVAHLGLRIEPIGPFSKDAQGRYPYSHSWSVWGENEDLEVLVRSGVILAWNASEAKLPYHVFGSGSEEQRKAAAKRQAADKRIKAELSLSLPFSARDGKGKNETGTICDGKQSSRKSGESFPDNPDNPADSQIAVLREIAKIAKLG